MSYKICRIENLEELIEEHRNISKKISVYEFDETSYTLLLIEINKVLKENKQLKEQLQQKEDIINKAKEFIKKHNEKAGKLYYKYNNKYLLSEIKEDLLEILDNKGETKDE